MNENENEPAPVVEKLEQNANNILAASKNGELSIQDEQKIEQINTNLEEIVNNSGTAPSTNYGGRRRHRTRRRRQRQSRRRQSRRQKSRRRR